MHKVIFNNDQAKVLLDALLLNAQDPVMNDLGRAIDAARAHMVPSEQLVISVYTQEKGSEAMTGKKPEMKQVIDEEKDELDT